ncbi:MAG: glycoside hydrolase family 5 protein, partial [Treponema sp.]|nr:glycoside hydrolase family 5 protein [Treponema sp.]
MKKIIAFVQFVVLLLCFTAAKEKDVPKVQKTMPFTKGINLTGWLEGYSNNNWRSDLFGKQDFEDIKSLGVEIVRIPIFFEEFSSGAPDYIVEDWLWQKIDNAVEWCTELKMYMIIDFHNDCGYKSKTKPKVEDMLLKVWKQVAERYKNSGEYVLYEIMNEPHFESGNKASDVAKWGKLQGNVLKAIRAVDKKHTVIVCAEDYCSVKYLLKLPDYKDDNLIYNFHDYTPMLFTHQGASWAGLENVRHIPFPYSEEKMPEMPKKQKEQGWIESLFANYKTEGIEENLVKPLDEAVKFANKRGVALMCNEYGVVMTYADSSERVNWYRLKGKWMEERNICRVSWDYRDKLGVFTNDSWFPTRARFPEDLNVELIKAMGLNVPPIKSRARHSWLENAKKSGDYTIYRNGFAKGTYPGGWCKSLRINKKDSASGETCIYIEKAEKFNAAGCFFGESCNFSSL